MRFQVGLVVELNNRSKKEIHGNIIEIYGGNVFLSKKDLKKRYKSLNNEIYNYEISLSYFQNGILPPTWKKNKFAIDSSNIKEICKEWKIII